jgi:hypothetical protein
MAAQAAVSAAALALAQHRRERGLPVTAVTSGPLATHSASTTADTARRHGLRPMGDEPLAAAVRDALTGRQWTGVLVDIDWDRFMVAFTATRPGRLFDDIPEARSVPDAHQRPADPEGPELARRVAAAAPDDRTQILLRGVRTVAAAALGHPGPESISADRAFRELGFDSVLAVDLRNRLRAVTGLDLPSSLVFDYPTPVGLTEHLLGLLHTPTVTVPATMTAELARLESALPDVALDEPARRQAVGQLRRLLSHLESGSGPGAGTAVAERLRDAATDELLDFIDLEFGPSSAE